LIFGCHSNKNAVGLNPVSPLCLNKPNLWDFGHSGRSS
jgi:hypothetical protein